ncbi:MAG: hypothetical protein JJT94_04480 [Bernardetiaceae bacterium]|nr:hypothetical protein [Bernardetiaceae bacterium]
MSNIQKRKKLLLESADLHKQQLQKIKKNPMELIKIASPATPTAPDISAEQGKQIAIGLGGALVAFLVLRSVKKSYSKRKQKKEFKAWRDAQLAEGRIPVIEKNSKPTFIDMLQSRLADMLVGFVKEKAGSYLQEWAGQLLQPKEEVKK